MVRDNQGRQVIAAGQALTDSPIQRMNWLVEGVLGKLPWPGQTVASGPAL